MDQYGSVWISMDQYNTVYPLVNVYITMENHHFQWVNPLSMMIFNSHVSHYQRVKLHHSYTFVDERASPWSVYRVGYAGELRHQLAVAQKPGAIDTGRMCGDEGEDRAHGWPSQFS